MTKEKQFILTIKLSPEIFSRLKEIAASRGGITNSAAIRESINNEFDRIQKKHNAIDYGYKGIKMAQRSLTLSGKKDELGSRRTRMNEMNDEELTAWLVDLGYMKEYETTESGDTIRYFISMDQNTNKRTLFMRRTYANGSPDYVSPLLNWDELMAELKKEKFII